MVLFTADIRALEFRPGGDSRDDGLYVVTDKEPYCLLPYLDGEQTNEVIRAITAKFPGLAENWQVRTGKSEHFFTLGLGKTK